MKDQGSRLAMRRISKTFLDINFQLIIRNCAAALLIIGSLVISGCSTLKPVQLTESFAEPPANALLWSELTAIRRDDWIHLLNTGEEALEWRLRAIDSATQSIDMQTFLWADDEVGLTLLLHLLEAADRGVRVRLLLDDTFLNTHSAEIWNINHHPNIEYRVYNPFLRRNKGMLLRQLMNIGEFGRLNHRMHNKALIVDNRAAIVGGRNLADEYFGAHKEANFRDLEVISSGPHVGRLSELFDIFWNNHWTYPEDLLQEKPKRAMMPDEFVSWLKQTATPGLEEDLSQRHEIWGSMVSVASSSDIVVLADDPAPIDPDDRDEFPNQLALELVKQIDLAERELILVSAYLIPTPELEDAIERAESRGVEVRILTNSLQSNNHTAAHSAYRKHVHQLVFNGADVHEVHPRAKDRSVYMRNPVDEKNLGLHAKFLLIDDDISIIGSANLDPRSLRLNTEMALIIRSNDLNSKLRGLIELDFSKRNAWHLEQQPDGSIHWVSDKESLDKQPSSSTFQRLEDWFLSVLPIEDQM